MNESIEWIIEYSMIIYSLIFVTWRFSLFLWSTSSNNPKNDIKTRYSTSTCWIIIGINRIFDSLTDIRYTWRFSLLVLHWLIWSSIAGSINNPKNNDIKRHFNCWIDVFGHIQSNFESTELAKQSTALRQFWRRIIAHLLK